MSLWVIKCLFKLSLSFYFVVIFTILFFKNVNALQAAGSYSTTTENPDTSRSNSGFSETNIDLSVALQGNCFVVCQMTMPSLTNFTKQKRIQRHVAFSVSKNDNFLRRSLANPKVVMYDHLLLNHGNAFDMTTSTFTATTSGTYSFQFTVFKILNRDPVTVALTVSTN